ncbi:MAG: flagellar hook-basal body complex protein FliE [Ectothiorhodospiraceae bacterium]|jgi:flagellar hook-basal body complex protein FliE|nr:flagellar hook-basal body complex protein FliE [Ectothiorhodospiraceae bacterium]
MSDMQISQVLQQMRALAATAGIETPAAAPQATDGPSFASLLKQSLGAVNEAQQTTSRLQTAFEAGDPNVDLSQVMVTMQKSSLAFDATVQVRNKLLEAYKEIMSMPL